MAGSVLPSVSRWAIDGRKRDWRVCFMGCMGMQPGLSHHLALQDWLIQSQLPLNLPNGAKIILGILPSFISKLLSNQLSRNGTEEVILKRFCPELESNPRPVRYPDFARLLHLCLYQLCHLGVKREAECKQPLPTYPYIIGFTLGTTKITNQCEIYTECFR